MFILFFIAIFSTILTIQIILFIAFKGKVFVYFIPTVIFVFLSIGIYAVTNTIEVGDDLLFYFVVCSFAAITCFIATVIFTSIKAMIKKSRGRYTHL